MAKSETSSLCLQLLLHSDLGCFHDLSLTIHMELHDINQRNLNQFTKVNFNRFGYYLRSENQVSPYFDRHLIDQQSMCENLEQHRRCFHHYLHCFPWLHFLHHHASALVFGSSVTEFCEENIHFSLDYDHRFTLFLDFVVLGNQGILYHRRDPEIWSWTHPAPFHHSVHAHRHNFLHAPTVNLKLGHR